MNTRGRNREGEAERPVNNNANGDVENNDGVNNIGAVNEVGAEGVLGFGIPAGWTFEQYREIFRMQAEAKVREQEVALRQSELNLEAERLRMRAAGDGGAGVGGGVGQPRVLDFNVHAASNRLSKFDEHDVDAYLQLFEKIARSERWPIDKWVAILQPHLVGKALKAFSKLSMRDIDDYDVLKEAILLEYEVVGEVYRRKFRKAVKRQGDSFSDFAQFLSTNFNHWIKYNKIDSVEKLKQLLMLEQFLERVSEDVKMHIVDKGVVELSEAAKCADAYVAMRRSASSQAGSGGGGARSVQAGGGWSQGNSAERSD